LSSLINLVFGPRVSAALLLLAGMALADNNGGLAGAYTRYGLGAPHLALGSSGTAGGVSGFSFYYNPANTAAVNSKNLTLSYRFLSLDRRFQYISWQMPVKPAGGITLGWLESGDEPFEARSSIGTKSGTIKHSANAFYMNFARPFSDKLSAGLTFKYLLEYINDGTADFDYQSSGLGFDLGLLYRWNNQLVFGATIRDINSRLKASTTEIFEHGGTTIDKFPMLYRVGAAYSPQEWLRLLYDFEFSDQQAYDHHAGLEIKHGRNVALRLGLDDGQLTFGSGLDFRLSRVISHLDYAFVQERAGEGSAHVFSWQFFF